MVLDHVAESSGFFVIATALADAKFLADGDLHVIDGFAIPKALENGIGETEHQDVLDRFLAEIMVDAEDLLLARVASELGIQLMGGGQIVAERFLDDNAL